MIRELLRQTPIRVIREPVSSQLRGLYRKYQDATMIQLEVFAENLALAKRAMAGLDGAVVECGTWRGGMAAALMEIGGPNRSYLFFDSFEGLPPAKEIDGDAALHWQANPKAANYYDNCSASIQEFEGVVGRVSPYPSDVQIYKGFFADTLPKVAEIPPIAVLRLDGDWYDSTMECLKKFWDSVVPGGLILIDDYAVWDGCTRAVHDFLSRRQASEPIVSGRVAGVTYITKRGSAPA